MKRALLVSYNLIGDGLYVGPVAEKWYREQGHQYDEIHLLTMANHAVSIYDGMGVPWKVIFEREGEYDTEITFDISKAFQISDKKKCHLVNSYAELAGISPDGLKAVPNYKPPELEVPDSQKGLVLLSMHSLSCSSRENPPKPPNKMLPWDKWIPLISTLRSEYPNSKLRVIGGKNDIPPALTGITEEEQELLGLPVPETAKVMQYAECIVTVDNGMGHLAASQGLNEFLFVPACLAMHYIVPWGHRGLRAVHVDPVTINPTTLNWHLKSAIRDWKFEKENRNECCIAANQS